MRYTGQFRQFFHSALLIDNRASRHVNGKIAAIQSDDCGGSDLKPMKPYGARRVTLWVRALGSKARVAMLL